MDSRTCIAAVTLAAVVAGCGGEGRPASPPTGAGTPIPVSGRERIEWEQPVAEGIEVSQYRFAVYVDAERTELPEATCRLARAGTALCSAPLPPMSPGVHVLKFVTYIPPENVESTRSTPLTIIVSTSADGPAAQD